MVPRPGPGAPATSTSTRLSLALLGYFTLVTLVITLSPFDFAWRPLRLSFVMTRADMVANVALFLPIGFLIRSAGSGTRPAVVDVLAAAVFSLLIETAQIFIPGRYVSPIDFATNTCGAWLGVAARDLVARASVWQPHLVGRIGLDIPLVGLLYLLVPQLWLSGVGLVEDPMRSLTTLLLGCAGSIVLVALHRHRWQGGIRVAAQAVPPLGVLWLTVGVLPTLSASPRTFMVMAVPALGVTLWLMRQNSGGRERRFEAETLRRFVPVFAAYLVVAALWPPVRSFTEWHGAIGFANRLNNAGVVDLLLLLEQVGGFTLLGYAAAEWRGRRELPLGQDVVPIAIAAAAFAGALEVAQGFLSGPGASLLRAVLSTTAALYGTAVYHLARAHVQALRAGTLTTPPSVQEAA